MTSSTARVLRLDISVDDAAIMHVFQGEGHPGHVEPGDGYPATASLPPMELTSPPGMIFTTKEGPLLVDGE